MGNRITFENYFKATIASFKLVNENEIAGSVPDFKGKFGCEYYYSIEDNYVYRKSKFWNTQIKRCHWFLEDANYNKQATLKTTIKDAYYFPVVGKCKLSDFININKKYYKFNEQLDSFISMDDDVNNWNNLNNKKYYFVILTNSNKLKKIGICEPHIYYGTEMTEIILKKDSGKEISLDYKKHDIKKILCLDLEEFDREAIINE